MNIPKKLEEKRDELAAVHAKEYEEEYAPSEMVLAQENEYKEAFNAACNLLLPEIKKLEKAIQHCEKFDTSGRMGRYGYGEVIRGHKPEPGTRFKTPKEKAREALQFLREFLGSDEKD